MLAIISVLQQLAHELGVGEMQAMVKKYQQRFKKVEDEMDSWAVLPSRLLSPQELHPQPHCQPPPSSSAKLLQSTSIQKVWLYDFNPAIIKALANTDVRIIIGAANDDIRGLASDPNFTKS
ncbi:hypothetical protein PS2_000012 [Malus domestica]